MKIQFCIVFFGFSVIAAVISQKELEILALPYQNQMEIFKNDQKTYDNLMGIAKDNKIGFSKRWKAIIAATELKKDHAIEDLYLLSFSKEWFIKNAVLIALDKVHHPQKSEILKRLLKDSALVVRSAAVEQISKEGVDNYRDLLWNELFSEQNKKKNQSLWIRNQIIKTLSVSPKSHEKSLFLKLLNEKENEIVNQGLKGAQRLVLNSREIKELSSEQMSTRLLTVKKKLLAYQN